MILWQPLGRMVLPALDGRSSRETYCFHDRAPFLTISHLARRLPGRPLVDRLRADLDRDPSVAKMKAATCRVWVLRPLMSLRRLPDVELSDSQQFCMGYYESMYLINDLFHCSLKTNSDVDFLPHFSNRTGHTRPAH